MFETIWENYKLWQLEWANDRLQIIQGTNTCITIYIPHGYCFQTWEDSRGQLHTSKPKLLLLSLVKHCIKSKFIKYNWGIALATTSNTGSKHPCLTFYFKSCAVHMIHTMECFSTYLCWTFQALTFFWDKAQAKM